MSTTRMFTYAKYGSLGLGLLLYNACGAIKPSDTRSAKKEADSAVEDEEKSENGVSKDIELEIKAEYSLTDSTVVMLVENSNRITDTNSPFRNYLYNGNEHALALQNLIVRLRNLDVVLRFGLLSTMFDSDAQLLAESGNLRPLNGTTTYWIDSSDKDFISKGNALTNLQGTGVVNRSGTNAYRPATTLAKFADYLTTAGKSPNGMHVKDRNLVIISIGYMDERNDGVDVETVLSKLASVAGGLEKVRVHTLAPPRAGCRYTKLNSTDMHTNSDASAANSTVEAEYTGYLRASKMILMQEKTNGFFASICDMDKYLQWTDDIVNQGILPPFFTVDLKEAVEPGTLKVSINGTDYKNWHLEVKDEKFILYLGTDIKNGTPINISYKTPGSTGKVIDSGSETTAKVETLKAGQANAALVEFNTQNFANDFQDGGCQACHNWADPTNSIPKAANILDRIKRASTVTGAMPLSPAAPRMPQSFIDRWTQFISEYPPG